MSVDKIQKTTSDEFLILNVLFITQKIRNKIFSIERNKKNLTGKKFFPFF